MAILVLFDLVWYGMCILSRCANMHNLEVIPLKMKELWQIALPLQAVCDSVAFEAKFFC